MKYKSCSLLEHGVYFSHDSIWTCCYLLGDVFFPLHLVADYKGGKVDWESILQLKRRFRKECQDGKIYDNCKNCYMLEEKEWPDDDYINEIYISHFTKCNCNCSYCYTAENKKHYNNLKAYKVVPLLRDMVKNNIIKHSVCIHMGGGEPTIYDELDDIIKMFAGNGNHKIMVPSSGIKYSKVLDNAMKNDHAGIIVSIDAGTRETYKKVKQVDAYRKVVENLKKYASTPVGASNIESKYIIVPDANDNKKEIDNWLAQTYAIGIRRVLIDVEMSYYRSNKDNPPKHLVELIEYAEKEANNMGITIQLSLYAKQYAYQKMAIPSEPEIEVIHARPKYKSCEYVEHGVCISSGELKHCPNRSFNQSSDDSVLYRNGSADWDKFFNTKSKMRENHRAGNFDVICQSCSNLKEENWDETNYIDKIFVNLTGARPENGLDIIPLLKNMAHNHLLKFDASLYFGGQEPTIYSEFEEIIQFCLNEIFKKIHVETNGLVFSESLAKAIYWHRAVVTIHKIIDERRERENHAEYVRNNLKVTENIKKYSDKVQGGNDYAVVVKTVELPKDGIKTQV